MNIVELNPFAIIMPYVPKYGRLRNFIFNINFACYYDEFVYKMNDSDFSYTSCVCERRDFLENIAKDNNFNDHTNSDVHCKATIANSRNKATVLKLDGLFFSLLVKEIRRSRKLRYSLLSNVLTRYKSNVEELTKDYTCSVCKRIPCNFPVFVKIKWPGKDVIDIEWSRKVLCLSSEKCELENAMAWLSTLGGAFSAFGDGNYIWAERAGIISMKQFHIALKLGDPLTICRCKIYLAMSLVQRGYYKKAKLMIRELYTFSLNEGASDFRLRNMCIAVWNRLKYCLWLKKIEASS